LLPGEDAAPLKTSVRYTVVPANDSLDHILSRSGSYDLKSIPFADIEFGVPDGPTLVMLQVENAGDAPGTWVFTTDRASLRRIELFQLAGDRVFIELARDDIAAQKQQLGCSLEAKSVPGQGSVFEFSLPIMPEVTHQQRIAIVDDPASWPDEIFQVWG
jgi:hypothetical protein